MKTVALAGATTGFGLTFLRQFFASGATSKHNLVLLSRSPQPHWSDKGADVRPVDYTSHSELVAALRGVDTVVSLIGGGGLRESQLALVAAAKAAGVRRFAPSEFAASTYGEIELYGPKREVWEAVAASGMEHTRFSCGLFMSILATGTPKAVTAVGEAEGCQTGEEEALAGLRPWNFVVNMKAGTVDYPADGTAPMVLTDMRDIARFTIAALDLETWPEELGMRGDVKSFCELVAIVEKVQGRKFLVKENSVEEMTKQMEENPATAFYNQARIAMSKDWAMVPDQLNKAFPDIKPMTAEEFVQKWWSGVDLPEPAWEENKVFGRKEFDQK